MNLQEKLRAGKFVITVELDPPKGADALKMRDKASKLCGLVDAVNIADCPMANLRMSPIALSHIIQHHVGLETIFHLTCRDRNIIGLQAELLGAGALGVRNILTLTGDQPTQGDHPQAQGVFELDSTGLIRLASSLNAGQDSMGNPLEAGTQFFIGSAINPAAEDVTSELKKLEQKIQAGVHFVQTQPVFDVRLAEKFLAKVKDWPVFVIMGVLPLKSYKMANYLQDKVPGIDVPEKILRRMESGEKEAGLAIARELMAEFRPMVDGVHIMPLNAIDTVLQLVQGAN